LHTPSGRQLLIPDKVFFPRFTVKTEDEKIIIYSGRDNCAPVVFYHGEQKLYLDDVKDVHMVIDGKLYINSIHKFFTLNTGAGTAFFILEKHYCDLFPKGKNRAKLIFITDNHPNGVVWTEDFIFDLR
jgi:hypothetical protein